MDTESDHNERIIQFATDMMMSGANIARVAGKLSQRVSADTEFKEIIQLANQAEQRWQQTVHDTITDSGQRGIQYAVLRDDLYSDSRPDDESGLKGAIEALHKLNKIELDESDTSDSEAMVCDTTRIQSADLEQSDDEQSTATPSESEPQSTKDETETSEPSSSSHHSIIDSVGTEDRNGKTSWSSDDP